MSLDWGPRTCEQCGKTFLPTRYTQKTCSVECRKARLRAWHAEWKRKEWARKHPQLPSRPCVVCQAMFQPTKPRDKTCSVECRAQRKRDVVNGRNRGTLPQFGDNPRTCEQCGKSFLGHPNAITCSAACMRRRKRDARRAGKTWYCIACDQPFEPNRNDRYTCSPACRRAAMARKNKRAATPERNRVVVAKRRHRKQKDPAYRTTLAERDRRQRRKQYLLQATLDVMKVNEYEDRTGSPIEERHAGTEPGSSA